MTNRAARSARNVETRKKKAKRRIPRAKVTRNQGNTKAVRIQLKKESGYNRVLKEAIAAEVAAE